MRILIKTKNLELCPELKIIPDLEKFINKEFEHIKKFAKAFQEEIYFNNSSKTKKPKIELWVEVGKETRHHKKGPFFLAEAQMRLFGRDLRVVVEKEDLKTAIIEARKELERQIKEHKGKLIAKFERNQRKIKKEFHFSPEARFFRKGRIKEEGV